MDVKRVRRKMGKELDEVLWANDVLAVNKEPVLPLPTEDRTEWLLWCTNKYNCTMDQANDRYWNNHTQMGLLASGLMANRERTKERNAQK